MDTHEIAARLTSLEARMKRMEHLMQQLIMVQISSQAHSDQVAHMREILQELRNNPAPVSAVPQPGPGPSAPQPERPEMAAIRQALLAGDKMKAIQIYRAVYGVGLPEAQAAINAMR